MAEKLLRRHIHVPLPKGYQAAVVTTAALGAATLYLFYPQQRKLINYIASDGAAYHCGHCPQKAECPAFEDYSAIRAGECLRGLTASKMTNGELWVTTYPHVWQHSLSSGDVRLYAWQEDSESNTLKTMPYRYANVYSDARVCWGNAKPKTLGEAVRYYWSAPFNNDLSRDQFWPDTGFLGYLENWQPPETFYWQDSSILSRPNVLTTKEVEGFVISARAATLNGIPPEYLYTATDETRYLTAWTRQTQSGLFMAVTHPSQKHNLIVAKKSLTTKSASIVGTSKDFPDLV